MSEFAVLDNLSGEAPQGCEVFEEWTSYDSGHWHEAGTHSSCLDDWSAFHGSVSKIEEAAHVTHLLPHETGHSGQEHKVENGSVINPWFVFHNCFSDEDTVKDAAMLEISPLSHLIHRSAHEPSHQDSLDALSKEAASLCHHMLCEPDVLRLLRPKPNLHSQKQLINTLQLKHSDLHNLETTNFQDLGFVEPESSVALIQTKLVAQMQCQNAPGFVYQISRQWFSQQSMRLPPPQDKKDLVK